MNSFWQEKTFFTKLLLRFFAITMIVILIFGFSVIYYFNNFYLNQKEEEIQKNSEAVLDYLAASVNSEDKQEIVNWLGIIGNLNDGQAWLINPEGYLEFSYPYSFDETKRFSSYESIFAGQTISRQVDAADFDNTMMLVGIPVIYESNVIAALLVFTPVKEINATVNQITKLMFLISTLSLLLILFISYFWSRSLARPLANIGYVAAQISAGKFGKEVKIDQKQVSKEILLLAGSINIMSRKLAQTIKSLLSEKEKLQHVLSGMKEGLIAVNDQGEIILINRTAVELFNLEKSSRGKKINSIIQDEKIIKAFEEILTAEQEEWQEIISKKEQTNQYLLVHCAAISLKDELNRGAVALFHDISERYRFEQLQREFVANVSHELKAPLTSIRGSAELLLDGVIKDQERQQQYLEMILTESNRLTNLIDETLILAEIDAGGLELNKEKISLPDMINHLKLFFENIKKDEQQLEISVLELTITANREKLRRILINLLSNSVKFSPAGTKIKLKVELIGQEVKFSVSDQGTGIPQSELKNIWERFYKIDKARTPGKKSSGLGLAIVKQLVEEHNGHVFVKSEVNKGSIFGFYLPLNDFKADD
ncbi:sensor histidine kinase [Halanaerobium salsuginis]|uniref:histidine kinase n=1 Tax=Halanaerobium salsuginis TaxID=29563 RepID=A0A1I4J8A4_9FIRM|nr:ATP-binding protein [Halanaerobium salsuginis]SFL62441.1 two-component system, OmpR family, sensor histidine kinase ResE [Halanaerobium salsuginis]